MTPAELLVFKEHGDQTPTTPPRFLLSSRLFRLCKRVRYPIVHQDQREKDTKGSVTNRTFILKMAADGYARWHIFTLQVKHGWSQKTKCSFTRTQRDTAFQTMTAENAAGGSGRRGGRRWRRVQAKFFFRKLMSPLVDESWELTSELSCSSGSIFLASCFPSSTLREKTGS